MYKAYTFYTCPTANGNPNTNCEKKPDCSLTFMVFVWVWSPQPLSENRGNIKR
ncbi:hypothetical protein Pan258_02140 [Symmachiella dynata]|nr:hypothetical protein Pan258_02140 [Symmachiella dynata]